MFSASKVAVPAALRNPPPPVSLGLPVFNGGRFLAQALDCVLEQTFGDFELVVSDNASSDATQEIVRDYAARDARIRYVRQPYNLGVGNNWSIVARAGRGMWLKWISANDEYAPRLLEATLAPMRAPRRDAAGPLP